MQQFPGQRLLVVLFEVGQEGRICEVLQARGVVCHHIGFSWDILSHVAVAVLALVVTGKDALVSGCPRRGHRSTLYARDSRCVVSTGQDRGVANGMVFCYEEDLCDHACVLQITL